MASQIQTELEELARKYWSLQLAARREAYHVSARARERGWHDIFQHEAACYRLMLDDLEEILVKFAPPTANSTGQQRAGEK